MRIAFIGYEANIKNRVGSNEYAFNLLKNLEKFDKENEYIVYLPEKPIDEFPKERKGWRYEVAGPKKLWNILALNLALFKDRNKIDLVFSPGHYAPLFCFSKPLVISVMDLGFLRFPEQFTKPIFLKLKYWTWFSVKKANHVFAISNSTRDDIIKYYKIGKDKITTTYLGIDKETFNLKVTEKEKARVREKYQIKNNYILFLSTLKPSKNIEGLIRSFKKISEKIPQDLVIAGKKGWMFDQIFSLVKELNLENRIIFTDFVDKEDVKGLIAGADVFSLLSFWEGFGIPAIQAMAMKVPVIVSDRGSLPEIVGNAGLVVDPEDIDKISQNLFEISTNKNLREKLIKEGVTRAEKFSWEKCALDTIKKIKEIENDL